MAPPYQAMDIAVQHIPKEFDKEGEPKLGRNPGDLFNVSNLELFFNRERVQKVPTEQDGVFVCKSSRRSVQENISYEKESKWQATLLFTHSVHPSPVYTAWIHPLGMNRVCPVVTVNI